MLIQQHDNGNKGSFFIKENDELLAEMTYKWTEDHIMVIEHTEVNDKLAGKGIGRELVEASVEHARTNGHKIRPHCSFARKVFDKTPAYKDVLD